MIELSSTEQEIHAILKDLSLGNSWLLSALYSRTIYAKSNLLWDNLSIVVGLHSLPRVMAGDFNEMLK